LGDLTPKLFSINSPGKIQRDNHIASLLHDPGKPEGCERLAEVPAVVTVTVTGIGVEPLRTAELGDAEQLDPDGSPLQLNSTV
jgi:hypothetical protein